jgi:hypothetical protein
VTGIIAVFDARDALLAAIAAAKVQRISIVTAFSPAYDPAILSAADVRRSSVSLWTLAGAIAGAVGGLAFAVWTVQQWPVLIVGGKPLVALPAFLVIAFELMILVAVCAAMISFFAGPRAIRRVARAPYQPSFSEAHFGLLLACSSSNAAHVGELMARSGAATWRVV